MIKTKKASKDRAVLHGEYVIRSSKDKCDRVQNLIVNGGLENLAALLSGAGAAVGYLALGTGTAAPAVADTALGTEVYRTAVTAISAAGGTCTSIFTVLATEAVFHIKEIGIFAGGTSTPGSGKLISRALYDKDKTADEELYITRSDILGRA